MPRSRKPATATRVDLSMILPVEDVQPVIIEEKNSQLSSGLDTVLETARLEIQKIDQKTELAVAAVTQAIRTQAAIEKGRILIPIRDMLAGTSGNGRWHAWLEECNLQHQNVSTWIGSAEAIDANKAICPEEVLMQFGARSLNMINSLPEAQRTEVLVGAAESGKAATVREINDLKMQPETKLAKAQEGLKAAHERLADPDRDRFERRNDQKSERKYLETIEQLQSVIAEKKIKEEQDAKENQRLSDELEALQFDSDAQREQRVKRVSNNLVVSLPAVLADMQKYIAEKEHYPENITGSVDKSIETLIQFLKPLYA